MISASTFEFQAEFKVISLSLNALNFSFTVFIFSSVYRGDKRKYLVTLMYISIQDHTFL